MGGWGNEESFSDYTVLYDLASNFFSSAKNSSNIQHTNSQHNDTWHNSEKIKT